MNAFELITMCGGLDLTPMFDSQAASVKKFTRFHSQSPPLQTIQRIAAVLEGQGIEHAVQPARFKIRITRHNTHHNAAEMERGVLTCTVQVFLIAPGLYLVDWRRGHGDLLSYYKFYQQQRALLGELVAGQGVGSEG